MPNWCNNDITLRHADPAMIDRAQHSQGLLAEFLPTPQELMNTVEGSFGDTDKQAALEAQQQANIEKYGYKNWYDWNIATWGTKWDVELENVERVDEYTLTASFDSAWSPPIEAYGRLVELGFEIEAFYNEPGMAFCGKYTGAGDSDADYYVEYGGYNSHSVREHVGEEIDDHFGISEMMAQWEEDTVE